MMVAMRTVVAALLFALAMTSLAWAEDAPGFKVKLLDSNTTFDSRERLGKRPVVVRFQASWCKPCAKEAPGFARIVERYRPRGVDFIALHVQDTASSVRRFVRAHRIGYPVALDPRLAIANTFELKGTPATIVIDRRGAVAARIDGESAVTRLPRILDEVLRSQTAR
jgi:thiol-disulfide isomerase/thioredoxin